jgi:hypothetical protein
MDLVDRPHALLPPHLLVRRGPQVLAEKKPRWLGGGGDLLLSLEKRLRAWLDEREQRKRDEQHDRSTIIREKPLTAATSFSQLIVTNFFLYNDFACNSNNKWLYRFIPVR